MQNRRLDQRPPDPAAGRPDSAGERPPARWQHRSSGRHPVPRGFGDTGNVDHVGTTTPWKARCRPTRRDRRLRENDTIRASGLLPRSRAHSATPTPGGRHRHTIVDHLPSMTATRDRRTTRGYRLVATPLTPTAAAHRYLLDFHSRQQRRRHARIHQRADLGGKADGEDIVDRRQRSGRRLLRAPPR